MFHMKHLDFFNDCHLKQTIYFYVTSGTPLLLRLEYLKEKMFHMKHLGPMNYETKLRQHDSFPML